MSPDEFTILAIVVETGKLRWFLAGLSPDDQIAPLLRSQVGDFDNYLGGDFDEQIAFLRHRFAGVVQRGADRLAREGVRPGRIVFLADGPFQRASKELTDRIADHFAHYMHRPPVAYLVGDLGLEGVRPAALTRLAGELDQETENRLARLAPRLAAVMSDSQRWETAPRKRELADPCA